MTRQWTMPELVAEVAKRLAALPAPSNGQVRPVPDERTVRYYSTIGLLDRPLAMRGRTALYGSRHLAQVVAIKRLQAMGRSLADIQMLWPSLDDPTLTRMSGVEVPAHRQALTRKEFWKVAAYDAEPSAPPTKQVELRLELAPNVTLAIAAPDAIALSSADVDAIRAAAQPLMAELARSRLTQSGSDPDNLAHYRGQTP